MAGSSTCPTRWSESGTPTCSRRGSIGGRRSPSTSSRWTSRAPATSPSARSPWPCGGTRQTASPGSAIPMTEGRPSLDLAALQRVADVAAAEGAAVISRRIGRLDSPEESKGRAGDWVTSADWESESAIRASLERATPQIPVVGEEGGGVRGSVYWTVDPIDGTTNFLLCFPVVAVSIALIADGRPQVAAIRAPLLDLVFAGVRGGGARC